MNSKAICLSLSCCLVLLIGQGIPGQDAPVLSHPVQVSQPLSHEVVDYADFTGRTEAAESVEILPRVSGRIDKVAFVSGAAVKQGDLLFQIDPRPYQAELDKTEAEAGRAEARTKRLAAALERAKTSLAAHAITQEDFDRIAAEREDGEAAVQAARAERDLARLNLEWTKVTAPISGRVGRPLLARGSHVTADATHLATVSGERIYASVGVDERTFLRLRRAERVSKVKEAGTPVGLGFADEDGYPRRGQIDSLEYQVDTETDTVWLRALVPNADGLLVPGLSARVRFVTSAPHKALLVADAVVRVEQGQTYVFVVTERNVVERRNVELGGEHGGLRAVKEGLSAEDWVLVNGPKDVSPGMAVQAKRVAVPAPTKKLGVEWPSSSGNGQP